MITNKLCVDWLFDLFHDIGELVHAFQPVLSGGCVNGLFVTPHPWMAREFSFWKDPYSSNPCSFLFFILDAADSAPKGRRRAAIIEHYESAVPIGVLVVRIRLSRLKRLLEVKFEFSSAFRNLLNGLVSLRWK